MLEYITNENSYNSSILDKKKQRMTQKEARIKYQNLSKEKKSRKRYEKDIKILLKKRKKKAFSFIVHVTKIFLRNKSKS